MLKNSLNKILIVDSDQKSTLSLSKYLKNQGFDCRICHDIKSAVYYMKTWMPQLVVCDLLLPDGSAFELIKRKASSRNLKNTPIKFVFLSSHNEKENVEKAIEQGVSAYLVKPFEPEDLLTKIIFLFRSKTELKTNTQIKPPNQDDQSLYLYLTHLLLKQSLSFDHLEDKLFKLVKMLSIKTKGVRCSIINCLEEDVGVVVHSSDSKDAMGIRLDIRNYPEITYVKGTNNIISVQDIASDKNLSFIKSKSKSIDFNSMVVCPLWQHNKFFGVLSLKLPTSKKTISENELKFIEIVSSVISLTLTTHNDSANYGYWLKEVKTPAA